MQHQQKERATAVLWSDGMHIPRCCKEERFNAAPKHRLSCNANGGGSQPRRRKDLAARQDRREKRAALQRTQEQRDGYDRSTG